MYMYHKNHTFLRRLRDQIAHTPFIYLRGSRGHDRMVVRFTITYAISAYHH